jgi:hypothetical protein
MAARVICFVSFERRTWVCREIRRKNAITSWAGEKRAPRCGAYANRLRRNFLFPVSFQAILCRVVAAQYSTRTPALLRVPVRRAGFTSEQIMRALAPPSKSPRWGVIARTFAKRFGTRRAEPEIVSAGDRDSLHPSRRSGRLTHGSQNDGAPQWACLGQGSADFCEILERAKGLEPSTPTLARSCSTTELHPRPKALAAIQAPTTGRAMPNAAR